MSKITKDTILSDIFKISGAQEILTKYNLPCLSCPFAKVEMDNLKIGQICQMYGLDIDNLLKELNKPKTKKNG